MSSARATSSPGPRFASWARLPGIGLVALLCCSVVVCQSEPQADLAFEPLALGRAVRDFDERVTERLDLVAPPGPMEEWPAGLTIAQQTGPLHSLSYPWDLVLQYRVPLEYCTGFWPEHEPDRTVDQLCHDELMTNWQLVQGLHANPFVLADAEVRRLNNSPSARRDKALWLLAYAYAHRHEKLVGEGLADALLSPTNYVRDDALVSLLGPPLLRVVPGPLKEIQAGEGEQSVDLQVTTDFSYNSVATNEQVLLRASERGLKAVAIAGRGQLGDARAAERLAESLRAQGKLPPDFRVIPAEYIRSRNGPVLGLFLSDRVLEGQTLTATVADIHRLGGLAYMAEPGGIGAAVALRRLPFDGYLIEPGNFELFRTLLLLNDPRYADRPALYASSSTIAFMTGLPYSNVKLQQDAADPLRAGLAHKQGYAAGGLYLPWMMVLTTKPVAAYQKALNQYFVVNDKLAMWLSRVLGADHVVIRMSWDDAMRDLISLSHAWPAIGDVLSGESPLLHYPQPNFIEAEYGRVGVGYDRLHHRLEVHCRWRW